jgi:hypothetical protein
MELIPRENSDLNSIKTIDNQSQQGQIIICLFFDIQGYFRQMFNNKIINYLYYAYH